MRLVAEEDRRQLRVIYLGCRFCCCRGIYPRAQFLKKIAWLLQYIGYRAQPATRDNSEVINALHVRKRRAHTAFQ